MAHRIRSAWRSKFGPLPKVMDPEAEAEAWLDLLDVQIPEPAPIALHGDTYTEIPLSDADEERGDVIIRPDRSTRADLAHVLVQMGRESTETFPGPWHWRRWKLTDRVASFLYVTGLTPSGGGASWGGGDPVAGARYSLPHHIRGRRCYFLWKPRWWWECHKRQGWTWPHHKPEDPFAFGICAACVPCQTCGAHYECAATCPEVTG